MLLNNTLEKLKNSLKQLPGVGEKTAQRFALHLLSVEKDKAKSLAETISEAVDKHVNCYSCNMLSDKNPCTICRDSGRDRSLLCVVENTYDVYLLEETGKYNGYYFVLGHLLSPMEGYGAEEINLPKLLKKLAGDEIKEVILALNPSTEGETTINLIASETARLNKKVTRLSTGLPFGGNIEYSSSVTLSNAIIRRHPV